MSMFITISKAFKWFSRKKSSSRFSNSESATPLHSPVLPEKFDYGQVFSYFDRDHDGKISADELMAYFLSIGESLSLDEAHNVILEFDSNDDNLLEVEDFVRMMETDEKNETIADGGGDIRRAFDMFVVDKECDCITPRGLQVVLDRLGNAKTYEECEAMVRVFDLDGNGVIDFLEFHEMMMV